MAETTMHLGVVRRGVQRRRTGSYPAAMLHCSRTVRPDPPGTDSHRTPVRRIRRPEDIAACGHLISEDGSYIIGPILGVLGGLNT